MIKVNEIKKQ